MSQQIAITGATGMVGTALTESLVKAGHQVTTMRRGTTQKDGSDLYWDPLNAGICDPAAATGIDAIVHLAGESIAGGRWTAALKERIRSSRIEATRNLVGSLSKLKTPPTTLVCASAIGYYGDRGADELTEESPRGEGFLADVCNDWEAEAAVAEELGIRVVTVRIGVVLSPKGGALSKMLTPFRLGAGGNVGNGNQYWSWIGLHDLVRILVEAVTNSDINGVINAVSPNPMTNRDFTKVLGKVLKRPTIFPLPAFVAKVVLGEMADALLLSSSRVIPQTLARTGFRFDHAELESCLRHELQLPG